MAAGGFVIELNGEERTLGNPDEGDAPTDPTVGAVMDIELDGELHQLNAGGHRQQPDQGHSTVPVRVEPLPEPIVDVPPTYLESFNQSARELGEGGVLTRRLANIPTAIIGSGEFLVGMAADLTGALRGIQEAAVNAVVPDDEDARRQLEGVPGFGPISRKFMERIPMDVGAARERFAIHPITEAGKKVRGSVEGLMQEVSEIEKDWAESEFSALDIMDPSPLAATLKSISLDAAIMLLPALKAGKMTREAGKALVETVALRRKNGERTTVYPEETIKDFNRLSDVEIKQEKAARADLAALYVKKQKTEVDNFRIAELENQLDALTKKKELRELDSTRTTMKPDEILDVATGDQLLATTGETFFKAMSEGTRTPVVMRREGPILRIEDIESLERAQAAKTLGDEIIPVRIIEKEKPQAQVEIEAAEVQAVLDSSRSRSEALAKQAKGTLIERLAEASIDRQFRIKRALIQADTATGQNAVIQLELLQGATTSARLSAQEGLRLYSGLNKKQEFTLDDFIRAERVREIDASKTAKGERQKFEGGLDGGKYTSFLKVRERELGPEQTARFVKLTQKYFDIQKQNLDLLYKEGLLTQQSYNKLRTFDYAPTEYLKELDPTPDVKTGLDGQGNPISVPDSGVKYLSGGRTSLVQMSSRELMLETIFRVQARVFKNRTNLKLLEFVEAVPKNGLVRLLKENEKFQASKGDLPIRVVRDGETITMVASETFARQWTETVPEMSSYTSNALRWLSGSPIVKFTAVGGNPAFFITDIPRNIAHAYAASGRSFKGTKLYSGTLPLYFAEIAADMGAVMGQAWKKKGDKYEALIQEGGAPAFLAHIGRGEMIENVGDLAKLGRRGNRIAQKLGFLNEFGELWMRLAVQERALKKGLSKTEAAYEARRIIDYAQAGRITKLLDLTVPFLNPAVQATRTSLRMFKEDPVRGAYIFGQVVTGTGLLAMLNYFHNPEGTANIPDEDLVTGINIMLPKSMATMSADGVIMYPRIYIKTENIFMAPIGMVNMAMRRIYEDREPDGMAVSILGHLSPVTPTGLLPPTMDAALKLIGNHDFWFNKDVWTGAENIEPWAEYHAMHRKNATPTIYRWMGQFMTESIGIDEQASLASPERLRAVVDTFMADHPISNLGGQVAERLLWGETPDATRWQSMDEFWARQPGIRRVLRFDNPSRNMFQDMQRLRDDKPTERKIINDNADNIAARIIQGEMNQEQFGRFLLDSVEPEERERVAVRIITSVKIGDILNNIPPSKRNGIPPRDWWIASGSTHGEDRARIFNQQVRNMETPGKRSQMKRIARQLTSAKVKVKYMNPDFMRELQRLEGEQDDVYGYGYGADERSLPVYPDDVLRRK